MCSRNRRAARFSKYPSLFLPLRLQKQPPKPASIAQTCSCPSLRQGTVLQGVRSVPDAAQSVMQTGEWEVLLDGRQSW